MSDQFSSLRGGRSDPGAGEQEKARQHELKTWPAFFEPVFRGTKTFELRKNDRDYRVGDELWLREWSNIDGYSGRECWRVVTYIVRAEECQWDEGALGPGMVILGIIESKAQPEPAEPSVPRDLIAYSSQQLWQEREDLRNAIVGPEPIAGLLHNGYVSLATSYREQAEAAQRVESSVPVSVRDELFQISDAIRAGVTMGGLTPRGCDDYANALFDIAFDLGNPPVTVCAEGSLPTAPDASGAESTAGPTSVPVSVLKALVASLRAEGARCDTFHATMGVGYKVSADRIEALYLSQTPQPDSTD